MWADHSDKAFQLLGLLYRAKHQGTMLAYLLLYCKIHSFALDVDLGREHATGHGFFCRAMLIGIR